jgi:hypothetical protein
VSAWDGTLNINETIQLAEKAIQVLRWNLTLVAVGRDGRKMAAREAVASLSLDLDNQWSYMKTHGDLGWEAFPSYFQIAVPRILHFLSERDLEITFFIVGQDAALEKNREELRSIAVAGHEIGNHSFHHEPWLHLFSEEELEDELARSEAAIEKATGVRPTAFRGPGYSMSHNALRVLAGRGYRYDASTLPTYLGPLARAYYFWTARLSDEEMRQRRLLFGRLADGLRPIKPYRWKLDGRRLVEVPVTTMPIVKTPIHMSYLLYLALFSPALAGLYFQLALRLCLAMRVSPSMLLHPLDFLGCEDVPELSFFPGMGRPSAWKLERVGQILTVLSRHYRLMSIGQQVELLERVELPEREPRFAKFEAVSTAEGSRGRV